MQFGLEPERTRIDLAEFIRRQLLEAGVRETQIYTAGLCTYCRADLFHSFRRDRENAGRLLSVIAVKHESVISG